MSKSVIIVGAGISGLSTAWLLRQDPTIAVTVLEASPRPGGTAWTERRDGCLFEMGPNGFLDNRTSTVELCHSLGLGALHRTNLQGADRFLFLGDRLRRLPTTPGEFLRSDILSWRGKIRALGERLVPGRRDTVDESIAAFGRRRIGREATEKILDAVVTGILAGDSELLSLPACFPRLAAMEEEFGSLIRAQGQLAKRRQRTGAPKPGSSLVSPDGGMRTLIEALAERQGSDLHLGTEITTLEPHSTGWRVSARSRSWQANAVVLACPAGAQAHLLEPIDRAISEEMAAIAYVPAVVAALVYRRSDLAKVPTGFGYLAPQRLKRPVLGVQWSSSVVPGQAPEDQFLLRAILGGWQRGDVLDWEDATIRKTVQEDLRQTLGINAEPNNHFIHRWEKAIPQYHLGHLDRLQRIETRLSAHRGLFLTGNALRGVAINDCTADAQRTAQLIVEYFRDAPTTLP